MSKIFKHQIFILLILLFPFAGFGQDCTPVITSQTTSTAVCEGKSITLEVTATSPNSSTLGYVWYKNGAPISGATNKTYTIASFAASDADVYFVEVTNTCTTSPATKNSANINLTLSNTPSIIFSVSQETICAGNNYTISPVVNTNGGGTVTYQWRKGSTILSGETSATLSFTNLQSSDAGQYTLDAKNSCGTTTSTAFQLNVTAKPVITVQPIASTSICVGSTLTLNADATNSTSGKWQKDGVDIGITSKTLTINPVALTDAGKYKYVAESICGPVNSNEAIVIIKQTPIITNISAPTNACVGSSVTLTPTIDGRGDNTISYKWMVNSATVSTSATLIVPNFQSTETYTLEAKNSCGVDTKSTTVQLISTPVIASIPAKEVCLNTTLTVTPVITNLSGNNISYQWYKENVPLSSQTSQQLILNTIQSNQAGTYHLVVNNGCTPVASNSFTVTVLGSPVINSVAAPTQPVCVGSNLTLSVNASSAQSYQWLKDGEIISGATSAQYSFSAISTSGGLYTVRVSNNCTPSVTSSPVNIAISSAPTITTAPQAATVCAGTTSHTFSVVANSNNGGTLQYQWKKDGVVISGATAASYTISTVNLSNAGSYTVEVSNGCSLNPLVSSAAQLTVNQKPSISTQPISAVVCEGNSYTLTASATGALSVRWEKNGIDIGVTSNPYTFIMSASTVGNYTFIATNSCGEVTSNTAVVTIKQAPQITSLTAPSNLCIGGSTTLTPVVDGRGDNGFSYEWTVGSTVTNITTPTFTISNFQATETYKVKITNSCGFDTKIVTIQAISTPTIATIANQDFCVNGNFEVNPTISNLSGSNITYQWYKGTTLLTGKTTQKLSFTNVQPSDAGTYYLSINNGCSPVTNSNSFTVKVVESAAITSVSGPTTPVCVGTDILVSVTALNATSYQWLKDGQIINGATSSTYTKQVGSSADGGRYSVQIQNTCGPNILSSEITVSIGSTPTITTQPQSATSCVDQVQTFSVAANTNNGGTLLYQWKKNGSIISGATTSTYTINPIQSINAGTYTVDVSNGCSVNPVTSTGAVLTVNATPVITEQPNALTTVCSGTGSFTLSATATGASSGKWLKDGIDITQPNASFTITGVTSSNAGNYIYKVTNSCGDVSSSIAKVVVNSAPTIISINAPSEVCATSTVTLIPSVLGNGDDNILYKWTLQGSSSTLSTEKELVVPNFQSANAGTYNLSVENSCGITQSSSVSKSVSISLIPSPTIQSLADATVCANTQFSASPTITNLASGTTTYQWYFEGQPLSDQKSAQLSYNSIKKAQSGRYYLAVSSKGCFPEASEPFLVTVTEAPVINSISGNKDLCVGSSLSLVVDASNVSTYKWMKGTTEVGNSSTYIEQVTNATAGEYKVIVSNACQQNFESNPITVTVGSAPTIVTPPVSSITVCDKGTASASVVASTNGGGPLKYVWKKETNEFGNTAVLSLENITTSSAGIYSVEVSNNCAVIQGGTVLINVAVKPTVDITPSISDHPQAGYPTVCIGKPFNISVTADGKGLPLKYQWYKDETPFTNSSQTKYEVAGSVLSDAGKYKLEVSNNCGTAVSKTVTVGVHQTPQIVLDPLSAELCEKETLTLTGAAQNRPGTVSDINYSWISTSGPVSSTTTTLSINNISTGVTGKYRLVASNECGATESQEAVITVLSFPQYNILTNQRDLSICNFGDQTRTLSLNIYTENSTVVPSIVWSTDVGDIRTSKTLPSITVGSVGVDARYYATIKNVCGQTEITEDGGATSPKGIKVIAEIDIPKVVSKSEPPATTICENRPLELNVTTETKGYQRFDWKLNNVTVYTKQENNYTSSDYIKPVPTTADGGTYTVEISNACGSIASPVQIPVTIYAKPVVDFTLMSTDKQCLDGNSYTFNNASTNLGTGTVTYLWEFGDGITGNDANTVIHSYESSGTYSVKLTATTDFGCTSYQTKNITVLGKPTITTQPLGLTACERSSVKLEAAINNGGTNTIRYQWYFSNDGIASFTPVGGNSIEYNISSMAVSNAGFYYLEISNDGCTSYKAKSETVEVKFQETPRASFTVNKPLSSCLSDASYIFSNTTTGGGSSVSYLWKVSDGTVSSTTNDFEYTFPSSGLYKVSLTASVGGCSSTYNINNNSDAQISINPPPVFTTNLLENLKIKKGEAITLEVNVRSKDAKDVDVLPTYRWYKMSGANEIGTNSKTFSSIPNAQVSDSGRYYVVVSNVCGSITSNVTNVFVNDVPYFVKQPDPIVVCKNQTVVLQAEGKNIDKSAPYYEWYFKKDISDTEVPVTNVVNTNAILTIPDFDVEKEGYYIVKITNEIGTTESLPVKVTLDDVPNINFLQSTPSLESAICIGDELKLNTSVTSLGNTANTLAWQVNGITIPGENASILTIENITAAYSGEIALLATNTCGTSTSKVNIKVATTPEIAENPQSISVCLDGTATFKAKITNIDENPFTYQWYKNNSSYMGPGIASQEQLILSSVQVADAGFYHISTSNACGMKSSASGELKVIATAPEITEQPSFVSSCIGTKEVIKVVASSNGSSLKYAWYKDEELQSSEIGSQIDFNSLTPANAGKYKVVVTNTCNLSTTSNNAEIVVKDKMSLKQAIADIQICSGNELDFNVQNSLSGVETSSTYRWKLNEVDINHSSAYTNRLQLTEISNAESGKYTLNATNSCGTSTLSLFTLKVVSKPEITKQPLTTSVCAGSDFTNSVEVSNPDQIPVSYQWLLDGVGLNNPSSSQLSLQNITSANIGSYAVRVTNICGTIQSNSARLSLVGNPVVVQNPTDINECSGIDAGTTIVARSDDNVLKFSWYKNDVLLPSQTSNKLSFARLSATDAGSYKAVISNNCNLSTNSSVIRVLVREKIDVINKIQDAERCVGTDFSIDVTNNLKNADIDARYQWKLNGIDFVNTSATSQRLQINSLLPSHAGQYNLVATNSCGSSDISMFKLAVANLPIISKQPLGGEICEKGTWSTNVALLNQQQSPVTYQWYKDAVALLNGRAENLMLSNLTLNNQGLYHVKITSACGEVTSEKVILTINPRPRLGINLVNTPPVQCLENNRFEFSSTAQVSDNTPVDLTWDFGDGVYSKKVNDGHSYKFADIFKVYLFGKSLNGCLDTAMQTVTVNTRPAILTDLEEKVVCKDAQLTFNIDVKQMPNENVAYQWYFNQAILSKETSKSITINKFTDANKGFYSVKISNACGSNFSNEVKADIAEKPLQLTLLPIDKKVCEGESITLKPGFFSKLPLTYQWFKNDLPIPNKELDSLLLRGFSPNDVAKYAVKAENICGAVLTPNGNLIIKNLPFTPQGLYTDTLCFRQDKLLKLDPIRNNDDTLRITWYRNNQLIQSGTSNEFALTNFNNYLTGLYKVVLSNSCGNVDVPFVSLAVNKITPGFILDTLDACKEKLQINLTDTSKGFFPIVKQYWDIPELRAVLPGQANVSYQFTTPGRYTVRHSVVDIRGCISDTVLMKTVNYGKPTAMFSIVDNCLSTPSTPLDTSYFGIGSSKLVKYVWDYGDTVMSRLNSIVPSYTYKTPGLKRVKLTVMSDSSCLVDSLVKTFMVYGKPVASFVSQDSCQGFPVLFTNTSSTPFVPDSVNRYIWNFDDGTTSTLKDPQHIFTKYGGYRVRLTAYSANCPTLSDDTLINMSIKIPREDWTYPRVQGLKGVTGQLFAAPGGRSYSWTPFTGLSDSRIQSPFYKLSDSKVMYSITIVDSAGCVNKDQQEVWVFEKPEIFIATGFSPNNDGINDSYAPEYIQIKYLEYFRIADKNNRQIFITNDMNVRWDGTHQGALLPPDPYVVTVSGIDVYGNRITKQGIVLLVR